MKTSFVSGAKLASGRPAEARVYHCSSIALNSINPHTPIHPPPYDDLMKIMRYTMVGFFRNLLLGG